MTDLEKKLWTKAYKYVARLRIVPFLRMVAVCNSLAMGKIDENSDIDLFIIAKRGRLFIVRSFVTILLHIFGVRRHGKKIAGRFCLSFFIDDSSLDLSRIAIENDVYLAYWMKTLKPIIDDGVSMEFLRANSWLSDYFENIIPEDHVLVPEEKASTNSKKTFENMFGGSVGQKLENFLKKWQTKRAHKKLGKLPDKSGIFIDDHILKFHNEDKRKIFTEKWAQKYGADFRVTDEKFMSL